MSRAISGEGVVTLACADITVTVKNPTELKKVNVHLKIYKGLSDAKLNHEKQSVSGLEGSSLFLIQLKKDVIIVIMEQFKFCC